MLLNFLQWYYSSILGYYNNYVIKQYYDSNHCGSQYMITVLFFNIGHGACTIKHFTAVIFDKLECF